MVAERLQKLMARAGLCSRRQAEEWIREGRVRVNGKVAALGDKADPGSDHVKIDGKPLRALLLEPADPQQRASAAVTGPESSFEELREDWVFLTNALNALNRSMGLPDAYPFTPSPMAGNKLRLVHNIVADWRRRAVG